MEVEEGSHLLFHESKTYRGAANYLTNYYKFVILSIVLVSIARLTSTGRPIQTLRTLFNILLVLLGVCILDLLLYSLLYHISGSPLTFKQGLGLDSDMMPFHAPKRSMYLLMKPGQFYIFSNLLLHRSHITNRRTSRKVLVMRFADKSVVLRQPHFHVLNPLYKLKGSRFVPMAPRSE
jgi:hypothetical protein